MIAGLWVLLTMGVAAAAEALPDTAMDQLVRDAYAQSPELKAAHARWQGSLERVPQEEALPDPTVAFGYFVERMDTRQTFRVEQMFPGWGKRGLRGEVARADADSAAEALATVAADVRLEMLQAAASYLLARDSAALVEANLELVENLSGIASQRYRTGDASQADVLRLESETEALRVELASWREREPALRAWVNARRGRPAQAALPELTALPPRSATPDSGADGLRQRLAGNPDLRADQAAIRQAERARALARRASRPDIALGVEYMENRAPAPDEAMVMVSVSIPLWQNRYRAQAREASADLRAAEQTYHARLNRLEADARRVHFELEDADRRVRLFGDRLIPRARQTLNIMEADYRTGRTGFLDLQEAQRTLLELEMGLLQARTDAFMRAAEWERLAGGRWDEDRNLWAPSSR